MSDVNILKPPPAFAGDARPKVDPAPVPPEREPPPSHPSQVDAPTPLPLERDLEKRARRGDLLILLALTLLGGVMRFIFPERPPLWGDDGFTFMRVCGTYQQMLDALQDWGFAPLHYELLWWIGQQTTLTPFIMRLVPAIAGTLMIPAMYWLARELAGRRAALLAALFAATSAYLNNYSRDAKMYMSFWLMCTVNFAALLWWLRTREGVAWWSWVASGTAMLGLNMLGVAVFAIELLAVILTPNAHWRSVRQSLMAVGGFPVLIYNAPYTRLFMRFRWPPLVLFVLGVAITLIGPFGYYTFFNRYVDKIESRGSLHAGGLGWVTTYNRGRDTLDLITFTATAHLYSWEWPRYSERTTRTGDKVVDVDDAKDIHPRVARWLKVAGVTIGCLLLLGLFPWPRQWNDRGNSELSPFSERPVDSRLSRLPGRNRDSSEFWDWPAATALVLAWVVLPTYVAYCTSVEEIISPPRAVAAQLAAWEAAVRGSWTGRAIAVAATITAAAAFVLCGRTMRERAYKLAVVVATAGGLFVACWLIFFLYERKLEGSVWMPRYLGFAWPAVAIIVAVLLLRLPTRPLRGGAVALLVGLNLAVYGARLFAGTEPPVPQMARDLVDSQPPDATVRMYYNVKGLNGGPPGAGHLWSLPGAYYLTLYSGKPTNPEEFFSSFGGGSIAAKFKYGKFRGSLTTAVANDAKTTPRLERLIVWESFMPKQAVTADDPVLQRLGHAWTRADEQVYPVRDHWTWRNLVTVRRRVYEKPSVSAVAPATRPATAPTTTISR